MSDKTYVPEGEQEPASQIGATVEALAKTIAARRGAGEESYTHRLLFGGADEPLKKVVEEANEVALAGKDVEAALADARMLAQAGDHHEQAAARFEAKADECRDHLRYEAGDVVYHLLVVLERYGIPLEELAAELNNRMTDEERPAGALRLRAEHVKRGK